MTSKAAKAKGAERKQRMDTSSLMEQILSKDNLNAAYLQVVRNKGAAGRGKNFRDGDSGAEKTEGDGTLTKRGKP